MTPTMNRSSLLALLVSTTLAFGAGCAASPSSEPLAEEAASPTAPAGLAVHELRADLARGSFTRDGATIDFEFSVSGGVHRARIVDADGVLLESKLEGDLEETVYLDGKARVRGRLTDEKPVIEGDATVFEQMTARASAPLVSDLKLALDDAKVPRDLFAGRRAPVVAAGSVAPLYVDRGWLVLGSFQSTVIGTTWQAWVYTELTLYPASGANATSGCVQALTGFSPPSCSGLIRVNANAWRTGARYYGYPVKVTNTAVSMSFQNVDLLVHVVEW